MTRIFEKVKILLFLFAAFFSPVLCQGDEPQKTIPRGLEGIWDPAKYISIDEVRPGMEAYVLTVYKETAVEKFPLDVISVLYNIFPGRNAILVRGTDERFIHSGPVAGCSGSPVYINGRLAGALAFGWIFSKDPLYGVTTIEDMLRAGQTEAAGQGMKDGPGLTFDFSSPIDFAVVQEKISTAFAAPPTKLTGATALPSPLIVSGLPDSALAELDGSLGQLGLMVVPGGGVKPGPDVCDVKITPGSCLVVPLVAGDIRLDVVGTVTEVRGDEVYGFGHSFLGYGAVDLPMATGQVHTVMASVMRSFKVATSMNIVGALTTDESRAVRGRLGAKARMIPLSLRIDRYNDPEQRVYNCQIADNRLLTPLLLRIVIAGTTLLKGNLPPDNTIEYKCSIEMDDAPGTPAVVFESISTDQGLTELIRDSIGPVALLMNNPFSRVRIKSIDLDVRVREKNIIAGIWSATLSKSKIKPGENFSVQVVTESFQAEKRSYNFDFTVPENTPAGNYQLIICGGQGYEEFLRKSVPHRFTAENLQTLVGAINYILTIGKDDLHCIMVLPASGVAMESAELPELPATKALILGDAKRANTMQAFPGWIDKKIGTGSIIMDQKIMKVTVER
ncbi:MAG: hypothetical protein JW749_06970 [Sedimentisphaerales bacterium]|nr:hypothetical protein [Sedimentisphaerales bacterium]